MSPLTEEFPGLQRLSLIGGVFYVHQNPAAVAAEEVTYDPTGESPTEAPTDDQTAAPTEAPTDDQPTLPSHVTEDGQLRPVPRGYALEFGTGRLVPLQYIPDGFFVIRSRGWDRF